MKNVLITGGAGFIGGSLAIKLVSLGYNVTVLDNLSPQIHGLNPEISSSLYIRIKDIVTFLKGSVTNKRDLTEAIKNQNLIVHLAAETGTGQSMYEIAKYCEVNVQGTALLLDLLANSSHQVEKIIVASSRSIYGEGKYLHPSFGVVYPEHRKELDLLKGDFEVYFKDKSILKIQPTDENSKIHPSSVYGITKYNQEQLVMTVCPTLGIKCVGLRYQNVYGPEQSLKNPYTGILSIFSTQIKNGQDIIIFEDGKESRDFVFIDDVVEATLLAIEKEEANFDVFNVGTGQPIDVKSVAFALVENYKSDVSIRVTGNFRLGDIRHNFADLSKISTKLGFYPMYNFRQGLLKFTNWVDNQIVESNDFQKSILEMKSKGLFK